LDPDGDDDVEYSSTGSSYKDNMPPKLELDDIPPTPKTAKNKISVAPKNDTALTRLRTRKILAELGVGDMDLKGNK